jgi:membrane-bound lytic murein transglycosylase F
VTSLGLAGGLLYAGLEWQQQHHALPAPQEANELVVLAYPGPASHFSGPGGEPSGFDVDLVRLFAQQLKLPVRFEIAASPGALIEATSTGRAHIGTGGLYRPRNADMPRAAPVYGGAAKEDRDGVDWSIGYFPVDTLLIYNSEGFKPRSWQDLSGESVAWVENTGLDPEIAALSAAHPGVRWTPLALPATDSLIAQVSDGHIGYALVASHVAAIARNIFLGFDVAFVAGGRRELAWVIPARFPALREAVDAFLARAKRDGTLDRLADRYFGHSAQVRRIDAGVFHDRIGTLLPGYRLLFQHAQAATGMEWRLLAAIAYQESQWDSLATSETGVRGMMQLTEETARHLGVRDRLDARQSILAAARYLTDLKRALPARIQEPDRTWLALAAFNIGMGHLEDARVLARKQKLDPDLWSNVKQTLPLLASPEFYQQAKLGYARGGMPVVFVDRVRAYYDILLAREAAYIPRLHVGNVSADPERATGIAAFGGP